MFAPCKSLPPVTTYNHWIVEETLKNGTSKLKTHGWLRELGFLAPLRDILILKR